METGRVLSTLQTIPSSWTCSPKKATVVRIEKFQVEYPTVGSARLLASANPKTSRG